MNAFDQQVEHNELNGLSVGDEDYDDNDYELVEVDEDDEDDEDDVDGLGRSKRSRRRRAKRRAKKKRRRARRKLKKAAKRKRRLRKKYAKRMRKYGTTSYSKIKKIKKARRKKFFKKIGKSKILKGIVMAAAGAAAVVIGGPLIKAGVSAAGKVVKAGVAKLKKGNNENSKTLVADRVDKVPFKTPIAIKAAYKAGVAKAKEKQADIVRELKEDIYDVNNDPAFNTAVKMLKERGVSDSDIEKEWVKSEAYADAAIPAVAQVIVPQIYAENRAMGMSRAEANDLEQDEATEIAVQTVHDEQQKAGFNPAMLLPLLAIPLIL